MWFFMASGNFVELKIDNILMEKKVIKKMILLSRLFPLIASITEQLLLAVLQSVSIY